MDDITIRLDSFGESTADGEKISYILDFFSDVGIKKDINQDACCARILNTSKHSIVLGVVCDGVGGLHEGEYASKSTVQAFNDWFDYSLSKKIIDDFDESLFDVLCNDMKDLIFKQNEVVLDYARMKNTQIGTTLTAMLFFNNSYFIAQVGDSRAYEMKNKLLQLTEDQSFVANEVRAGRMTPEEARHDKRRNVILQCLGATSYIEPEYVNGTVQSNATYFLCSDGFVHEMDVAELEELMNPNTINNLNDVRERIARGIQTVKKRGEKDNITVVMICT